MLTPHPPIIFNNIIYVFCEKLKHLENKIKIKNNPIIIYDSRLFVGN